jgi:acetyltransferase-like isoleucine patch superfamily enzyme
MKSIRTGYRLFRGGLKKIYALYCWNITVLKLWLNGVEFDRSIVSFGIPVISVNKDAKFTIGKNFVFKSGKQFNQIGRPHPTYFTVRGDGVLTIGNNVGMSNTSIVCEKSITIGNNVRIGANVVIYDTNFHSLDVVKRTSNPEDKSDIIRRPIVIEEGAFIGSHVTILKGVVIGRNSIVGSASVVTKSIPPNEIWAGNPAKFLRPLGVQYKDSVIAI